MIVLAHQSSRAIFMSTLEAAVARPPSLDIFKGSTTRKDDEGRVGLLAVRRILLLLYD